ncbi:putative ABC transport system permease protein [Clavibacter sp. B3I6]|uniref:ABC transporter permease n=1 Tax=Clavibacter sp. B3I6 TaxID=3042268 RepID=UPI0027835572|nr:ABC transporter permease [Clavibacter sp. B3I6]MDQ0745543.1 putative ABC transport system permease protein [Clavibacter sp. B3I6]
MRTAIRSVLVVNRASLLGTALVVALTAMILALTGAWLEAGVREPDLLLLSTVASSFAGTLLLIAVLVVAGSFSAALARRRRDFALLRAVGATTRQVRGTVTAEALVILGVAGPVGAVAGLLLAPVAAPMLEAGGLLPAGFTLGVSPLPVVGALAVLVPTGILAALLAARGILRVSPTAAVRESAVDPVGIGRGRRIAAIATAALGLLAAGTPFVSPGLLGSATGASSAILLVVAAGLAGPLLVRWAASRAVAASGSRGGAARVLAVANARGFSRRFSAAVIPLALLVGLGSVQSGTDLAVARAGEQQLRASVAADLVAVASGGDGITAAQVAAVRAVPGVAAITATGGLDASIRVEQPDPDDGAFGGLSWEPASLRTLTPGPALLDPAVREGSLDDLAEPGTIAVSTDALVLTGLGVGDSVDLRIADGPEEERRIVAVYDRGLGLGDQMVGAPAAGAPADAVLVRLDGAAPDDAQAAIAALGLRALTPDAYADTATAGGAAERQLSLVLLVSLLGLVAAAAATTLVGSTRGRREELTLLRRVGATRAQLMRTLGVETAFIVVAALAIGMLAVLPALTGIGQGLLGIPLPVVDVPVTLALGLAVVVIAAASVLPAGWRGASGR